MKKNLEDMFKFTNIDSLTFEDSFHFSKNYSVNLPESCHKLRLIETCISIDNDFTDCISKYVTDLEIRKC